MLSSPAASWLDLLWAAVCRRAARPIAGILLDAEGISGVAERVFEEFLAAGGDPAPNLQAMMTLLTGPVQGAALAHVARVRTDSSDPDALRDLAAARWQANPAFPELVERGEGGQLTSSSWANAEPILWNRVGALYRRLKIRESDVRDVYAETIADFLKARTEGCPFGEMMVFEEVPRLFSLVAERRAISWVRRQTTLKNAPNRDGISIDDPDTGIAGMLPLDRNLATEDPLANVGFDQMRSRCGEALDEFEWFVLEALFVEGSQTRDELVAAPETLEALSIDESASRSTRLRRLNERVADALARLGRALETTDF